MKRLITLVFICCFGCNQTDHSHDGVYEGTMGVWEIDGDEITMYFFNIETKGKIEYEGDLVYISYPENKNFRQVYNIEFDEDSTKMFVAGTGYARIEMKRISDEKE